MTSKLRMFGIEIIFYFCFMAWCDHTHLCVHIYVYIYIYIYIYGVAAVGRKDFSFYHGHSLGFLSGYVLCESVLRLSLSLSLSLSLISFEVLRRNASVQTTSAAGPRCGRLIDMA